MHGNQNYLHPNKLFNLMSPLFLEDVCMMQSVLCAAKHPLHLGWGYLYRLSRVVYVLAEPSWRQCSLPAVFLLGGN